MGPPGHFGVGLAAKPLAPAVPVGVFLLASEFLDLLSLAFGAIGLEKFATSQTDFTHGVRILIPGSIPWSHGLLMSIIWSILFGAVVFLIYRDRRSGVVLGLVVFSHWILDFIVHLPDLPLFLAGSPELGLGLWSSGSGLVASLFLEFALLAGGISVYIFWRKCEKQGREQLPHAS